MCFPEKLKFKMAHFTKWTVTYLCGETWEYIARVNDYGYVTYMSCRAILRLVPPCNEGHGEEEIRQLR